MTFSLGYIYLATWLGIRKKNEELSCLKVGGELSGYRQGCSILDIPLQDVNPAHR